MKVLITGRGTSGSWQIRGIQLGCAIGAKVEVEAGQASIEAADVVVVVKRVSGEVMERIKRSGTLLVWDVVDAWPQPIGNTWDRIACFNWLSSSLRQMKPDAVIAPTRQMAADCAALGVLAYCLPHHVRPGIKVIQIRERVSVVAYEGGTGYLGNWGSLVSTWCKNNQAIFQVNPADLSQVDILLAFREQTGYAPRNWKSNVKLANAQGSGTPIICAAEAGYLETTSGGAVFADQAENIPFLLSFLSDLKEREKRQDALLLERIRLDDVATIYQNWLRDFVCSKTK